jgi:hypothetical protein
MQPQQQPNGLRFLENLAYLVPGYQGYKRKNLRREEDSLFRARVVREVQQILRLLAELHERWVSEPDNPLFEQLLHRKLRLDAISESVRCGPYRSRRFFHTNIVRENMLDRILEADLLILEALSEVLAHMQDHWAFPSAPRNSAEFFDTFDAALIRLESHVIMREKTLATE